MACLDEEDVNMMKQCIKLDIDCADICRLTASLLSRGSEHGEHLLKEVPKYAMPVQRNAANIQAWNIAGNAPKYAAVVLKSAVQWSNQR